MAAARYFLGLDPAEAGVVVSGALMFTVSLTTPPASDGTLRLFFDDPREKIVSA